MFTIRKEQKDAWREDAVRDFENRMVAHIRRCLVEQWERSGEANLREVIQAGIVGAAALGIVAESDVCKFIDLMLVFGIDFHQFGWAKEILDADKPRDPSARMRRLFDRAMEEA